MWIRVGELFLKFLTCLFINRPPFSFFAPPDAELPGLVAVLRATPPAVNLLSADWWVGSSSKAVERL